MIIKLIISAYLGTTVFFGIRAIKTSQLEDRKNVRYLLGILFGSLIWPSAIILGMIDELNKK